MVTLMHSLYQTQNHHCPNLTSIVNQGMSKGVRRKGGIPKKKWKQPIPQHKPPKCSAETRDPSPTVAADRKPKTFGAHHGQSHLCCDCTPGVTVTKQQLLHTILPVLLSSNNIHEQLLLLERASYTWSACYSWWWTETVAFRTTCYAAAWCTYIHLYQALMLLCSVSHLVLQQVPLSYKKLPPLLLDQASNLLFLSHCGWKARAMCACNTTY